MFRIRRRHLGDLIKLSVFMVVSVILGGYLFVIASNHRSGSTTDYSAVFGNVSGLEQGDQVRVASVGVGKVKSIAVQPNSEVDVTFSLDKSITLTTTTTATVRYKNLIGDRYLSLEQPAGNATAAKLVPGATIGKKHTASALNLDTLLNGFKPLFVGLNPQQINTLSEQLIQVLQGQSTAVTTLVSTISSFTTSIGDRDELVGQVVDNLNTVLGTFDQRDNALGSVVDQLSALAKGLDEQAPELTQAATRINQLAADATGLLSSARTDLTPDLTHLQSVSATLNKNSSYLQRALDELPPHYKLIDRTGSYGDFFNFFLCGVRVRLTDEGSKDNVIMTPWINSDVPRCKR
ncbi:MAG: Virulence factor Mce family protein [Aeromicrobium sp.]|nr:Virulence factor Mce family protein [Aeromicrobium sp.]